MLEEQTAVEIGNGSQQAFRLRAALVLRFGEAFKKERIEKFAVVAVGAAVLAFFQFLFEIVAFVLDEVFLLQKIDEHQAVEQNRGIPVSDRHRCDQCLRSCR